MRKLLTVLFVLIFAAHAYGQTRIKPDRLQLDAQPWRYGPIYAPTGEFFLHRLGADILDATAISLPSDIWIQNATFGTAAAETLNVTGNITVDGTVDGEDVAGLGTRLDDYDSAGVILGSSSVTDLSDVTKAGSGAIISATERVIIENLDAADIILAGSSVTDLSDVSDAGSGIIISAAERNSLNSSESRLDAYDSAGVILPASSVTDLSDVSDAGSGKIITDGERTKLEGIYSSEPAFSFVIESVTSQETIPLKLFSRSKTVTLQEIKAQIVGDATATCNFQLEERAFGAINTAGAVVLAATANATVSGVTITSFADAAMDVDATLVFVTGIDAASRESTIQGTVFYRED